MGNCNVSSLSQSQSWVPFTLRFAVQNVVLEILLIFFIWLKFKQNDKII